MRTYCLSIILIVCVITDVSAQLSAGGFPLAFRWSASRHTSIPRIDMECVDNQALLQSDNQIRSRHKTARFAYIHQCAIDLQSKGRLTVLDDGGRLWQLRIRSGGAQALNLFFDEFQLPPQARLFVYTPDRRHVLGAFTCANNKSSGKLSIAPLPGDEIIVEYYEAPGSKAAKLHIESVGHAYRDIFGIAHMRAGAGSCHIDVCCPQGDNWQDEQRAVCRIILNDGRFATGVLVNNTRQDGHPYLLTANHVIASQQAAESALFFFNYQIKNCGTTDTLAPQSISGANLIATAPDNKLDMSLLELSTPIPQNFYVYYAGWNRQTSAASHTSCIHHPQGDVKKISHDDHAPTTANFGDTYDENSHWLVGAWDDGSTEVGSSGAPLFDQNHRIVGTLSGGDANCLNPINDLFAKFSRSWDDYAGNDQQLAHWLDPDNIGQVAINGYDPYTPVATYDAQIDSIHSPQEEYCSEVSIVPRIVIRNRGTAVLNSLKVAYQLNGAPPEIYNWTGSLQTLEDEEVLFPTIYLKQQVHQIKAYCYAPNGQTDGNKLNDSITKIFTVQEANSVRLDLKTDNYGWETSWQLTDNQDNILYQGSGYRGNQEIEHLFCLSDGCYTFTIFDEFSDGICCVYGQGSYKLTNVNTLAVIAQGGNFDAEESVNFCVKFSSIENLYNQPFIIYPNPCSDLCHITGTMPASCQISLWDCCGRLLEKWPEQVLPQQIDLSAYDNGLYFIRIAQKDNILTKKILIQR